MQPYLENWKKVDQKRILKQLDASLGQKRLVFGINQVWKAAVERKGRLLVVEKDFVYPAELSGTTEAIQPRDETLQHPFYIRDAVDDIIEKVLSTGGDVEFVEPGVLSEYQKIALIEYYT
jgi:peptide subunit release factor 1 (eRF1)